PDAASFFNLFKAIINSFKQIGSLKLEWSTCQWLVYCEATFSDIHYLRTDNQFSLIYFIEHSIKATSITSFRNFPRMNLIAMDYHWVGIFKFFNTKVTLDKDSLFAFLYLKFFKFLVLVSFGIYLAYSQKNEYLFNIKINR
ncbi:hypothetical protein BpHYR1_029391, partial [Brachionus plicatilis]